VQTGPLHSLVQELEPVEPFGITQHVSGVNELVNRAQVRRQRSDFLARDSCSSSIGKVVSMHDQKRAVVKLGRLRRQGISYAQFIVHLGHKLIG